MHTAACSSSTNSTYMLQTAFTRSGKFSHSKTPTFLLISTAFNIDTASAYAFAYHTEEGNVIIFSHAWDSM